jgi:hypothetical protein
LPDIIQPYRHYGSEVIQIVLDGIEKADECCADNSTIQRWKTEFAKAEPDIAQRLASAYVQETWETVPMGAAATLLDGLKAKDSCWLRFVMRLLINCGHRICTEFAFYPAHYSATVSSANKYIAERGRNNDKTIKDTS